MFRLGFDYLFINSPAFSLFLDWFGGLFEKFEVFLMIDEFPFC